MIIETPPLLFATILALLVVGLVTLAWGRALSRQAGWAVGVSLAILLAVAAAGWKEVFFDSTEAKTWLRGWILPNDHQGAVTVGVVEDSLGLVTTGLAVILALFAILEAAVRKRRANVSRPERTLAAIAVTTSGVALAWVSLTPWLALVGVSLTALGGFLSLGERWGASDEDAQSATRFAWEKWWGVILAWVGAALLAGSRAPLTLGTWGEVSLWGLPEQYDELGAGLLLLGLFVQLQSFPFLGWVTSASSIAILPRVLLNQVGPGLATFALLIRLEPHLRGFAAFGVFGWIALFSAAITMGVGLLQPTWRQSLASWISAGFATAFAILSASGAPGAFAFIVGLVLGTVVLSAAMASLGSKTAIPGGASPTWLKGLAFLGVASATGLAGFVSAHGVLQWISFHSTDPGLAALPFAVYFLFALNGWSLAWGALKTKAVSGAAWYQLLALAVLAILSLAVIWSGTLTGGFFADSERVTTSLIQKFFNSAGADDEAPGSLVWIYFALQALSIGLAYWMVGRSRDLWLRIRELFPKASGFVASGFHLEAAIFRIFNGVRYLGTGAQWLCERAFWELGVARILSAGVRRSSRFVSDADARLSTGLFKVLSRMLNAPAKFLQLVQNGDVQWYVLFAMGSGAAILIHFLISKEWMT